MQYQKGLHDKEAGVCSEHCTMIFHIQPTRPPHIARFDARSEKGDEIWIKFRLGSAETVNLYTKLTKWLKQHSNIVLIEILDVSW